MKTKLISIILVFTMFSCQENMKSNNTSQDVITMNVDDTDKEDYIKYSTFFDKIKVTILETKEDNLIGGISKIEGTNNNILILDARNTKTLYMFNKEGNYIRSIGRRGNGPGEYISPNDFTIDRENNQVYILDTGLRKILKYNIETGTYISSINVQYPDYHCLHIQYYNGKLYTDVKFHKKTPDSYLLQEIDITTGKQIKQWLSVDEYNCGLISIDSARPVFFSGYFGTPKFADQYMTTLFSLREDGVIPYLELESKDLLTKEYLNKTFGEKTFLELTMDPKFRSLNKIHNLRQFIETDQFITMAFVIAKRSVQRSLFYDKISKQINIGKPMDDLLCNEISSGKFNLITPFMASDAKGVYRVIEGNSLSFLAEGMQQGYIREDIEQYDKLKELTEDSNPIILYYEWKKQIE